MYTSIQETHATPRLLVPNLRVRVQEVSTVAALKDLIKEQLRSGIDNSDFDVDVKGHSVVSFCMQDDLKEFRVDAKKV